MRVGTQAVLLIGFLQSEVDAFRAVMQAMDADIVRLICCNTALLRGPLNKALEVEAVPDYEKVCVASKHRFFFCVGVVWWCVSDTGAAAAGTRRAKGRDTVRHVQRRGGGLCCRSLPGSVCSCPKL
jgi:hypothetical protein